MSHMLSINPLGGSLISFRTTILHVVHLPKEVLFSRVYFSYFMRKMKVLLGSDRQSLVDGRVGTFSRAHTVNNGRW